jgi:hypothetical protein
VVYELPPIIAMNTVVASGKSFPIGATVYPSGVNFSVFAKGTLF